MVKLEETSDKDAVQVLSDHSWEGMHIHVWQEALIIVGGYIVLTLYKSYMRLRRHRNPLVSEKIMVVFLGTAMMIYATSMALNTKLVSVHLY